MKAYGRMPESCCGCKHFRNKRFVYKRFRLGCCVQVDDGYMNDCLLDVEAEAKPKAKQHDHSLCLCKTNDKLELSRE